MILTQEQLASRLNSEDNLLNLKALRSPKSIEHFEGEMSDSGESEHLLTSEIKLSPGESNAKIVKWGGHSTKEREHYKLTPEARVTIGSLGQVFPVKDVAELSGVSRDCVRDLRNGKVGSSGYNQELATQVNDIANQRKKAAQDKAIDKLLAAMGVISEGKLSDLNAKDASLVAANMSRVAANLEPKESRDSSGAKIQVIIYQPKPAREEHFEVIEVGA